VSVLRVSRAILAAAGMAGALAGCGSSIPPEEPGAPVTAAALPHPRSGLWQWTSQAGGQKRLCLSGQLLSPLAPRPGCPTSRQIRTDGGAYVVETRCEAGQVSRTWAKTSGDYNRAFSLDIVVNDSRGDISDHADYRYLGPCAPGQHPDDQP
jgi:hypothetical protein